jgi:hypothetical protein
MRGHTKSKVGEVKKKVICEDHKKEIEIHCNKCDTDFCSLCFHRDHKGHDTIPLIDYAKSCQPEISKGLEVLNSKSKELMESKEAIAGGIQEINQVRQNQMQ